MPNHQKNYQMHRPFDKKYSCCYLAHNVDLTANVGSFFRIADALGVEKIYLTGNSITPPNDKIKRTSRSTEKIVPFEYSAKPQDVITQLKQQHYKIISLEITSNSILLEELELTQEDKVCLIVGAENKGVDADLLAVSDTVVHIPMLGKNSSMNVANACAIATYEITKQLKNKR